MDEPARVANPRRILAVSLADWAGLLAGIVHDITGSAPSVNPATQSLAGTTHALALRTAYYAADVPVWLDLVDGGPEESSPDAWAQLFLAPEARVVLDALGAVLVVLPVGSPPSVTSDSPAAEATPASDRTGRLIRAVGRLVRDGLGHGAAWDWDGVALAVAVGGGADGDANAAALDAWEDACAAAGLEFVHVPSEGKSSTGNEFGEKVGVPRVLEALQANDWAMATDIGEEEDCIESLDVDVDAAGQDEDFGDFASAPSPAALLDGESLGFGFGGDDLAGLKTAILSDSKDAAAGSEAGVSRSGSQPDGDGDEQSVEAVELMLRKLQAVRDSSAGLPDAQRRRLAARAVGEVMRQL